MGVSAKEPESQFVGLLSLMEPTAEFLAQLPDIAAFEWAERKARIAKDAEALNKRRAEQKTLNQKAITALINHEISAEDFETLKRSITEELFKIEGLISALDSERSAIQDLTKQAQQQVIDLVKAWKNATVNQRQELANGLFPEGLAFSNEKKFFEPSNTVLNDMSRRWLEEFTAGKTSNFDVGVPDGI